MWGPDSRHIIVPHQPIHYVALRIWYAAHVLRISPKPPICSSHSNSWILAMGVHRAGREGRNACLWERQKGPLAGSSQYIVSHIPLSCSAHGFSWRLLESTRGEIKSTVGLVWRTTWTLLASGRVSKGAQTNSCQLSLYWNSVGHLVDRAFLPAQNSRNSRRYLTLSCRLPLWPGQVHHRWIVHIAHC